MNNKKIKEYIIDKKIDIEEIIKDFARLRFSYFWQLHL